MIVSKLQIFLVFLIVVSFNIAVKNKQNNYSGAKCVEDIVRIDIDLDSKTTVSYDSLISEDISFIKLETTDGNILGKIDQILFTKDRIIVQDIYKSKLVSVYDYNGKFICNISKAGQGAEEYIYLSNIMLSSDSSMVILPDMWSQTLKYFTLDGRFVKGERVPHIFSDLGITSDNKILCYSMTGCPIETGNTVARPTFVLSDFKGKVFYNEYPSFYKDDFNMETENPIKRFDGEVYFNPCFNDTIFQIVNQKVEARFHINFIGYKPLVIDDNTTNASMSEYYMDKPNFCGNYFLLKDALYIDFFSPKNIPFLIYSKSKKQLFICNGQYEHPYFAFLMPMPIARYKDNILVSAKDPKSILFLKTEILINRNDKYKDDIDNLLKGLTEDSNPVLFFYKVKV